MRKEHISALRYLNLASICVESVLGGREPIAGIQLMAFANTAWLNTTCMTAGLFYLQERFGNVGIVNPAFTSMVNTEEDPQKRYSTASSFGAFETHRNYSSIAGVLHLPSHWTSFLFTPTPPDVLGDRSNQTIPEDPELAGSDVQEQPAGVCMLYDCDACHYTSMQELCRELLSKKFPGEITFVHSTKLTFSDSSSCGVLSLLFLELELGGIMFDGDALGTREGQEITRRALSKSIPYLRLRFLRNVMKSLGGFV
jgi:hypothetical protein